MTHAPHQPDDFLVLASAIGHADQGIAVYGADLCLRFANPRYAAFLESPLESLGRTIDGGTAHETYVCSQLLAGADKQAGTAMLVQAMEKTENPGYREALSWVLLHLTGERLGADPKKWKEWMEKKK